jgi:hypothetical protein
MSSTERSPFADGDRQAMFFEENCAKCLRHTKEYATLAEIACNMERSYFQCAIGLPIPVRHAKAMGRGVCTRKRTLRLCDCIVRKNNYLCKRNFQQP